VRIVLKTTFSHSLIQFVATPQTRVDVPSTGLRAARLNDVYAFNRFDVDDAGDHDMGRRDARDGDNGGHMSDHRVVNDHFEESRGRSGPQPFSRRHVPGSATA
jgi:hypothetical protein